METPQTEEAGPIAVETTGAPESPDAQEEEVFSVDFDGVGGEDEAGAGATASPESDLGAPSTSGSDSGNSDIAARLARSERETAELQGSLRTLINQQQVPAGHDPNRPPVTLEQLTNDPNATPADLVAYLEWRQNQNLNQFHATADAAGRRAASEQQIRGMMNHSEFGTRDFDGMRAKHMDPIYRENPGVRNLIQSIAGENPALAEYTVAWVYEIMDAVKGDPVKGFKRLGASLDAFKDGEKAATANVGKAFRRGADRVLSGAGGQSRTRKVGSAEDIAGMSDNDFQRFFDQTGS